MIRTLLPVFLICACTPDPKETGADSGDSAAPDVCAQLGYDVRPFEDAAEDPSLYATAADFTVTTTEGDWSLSEAWTGCDSYLLIQDSPSQNQGWPTGIWERDAQELFERLPRNVHLLFMSTATSTASIEESLDGLQAVIAEEEQFMEPEDWEWWQGHIHYVTQRAQAIPGWVGSLMQNPGWGVGIDRQQRIRYIGSYADYERYDSSYGWFEPNLGMVANEAIYYNFEAQREAELEQDDATVITVFDGDVVDNDVYATVDLPDADAMSGFDTLHIDCTMACEGDGEYGDCPAWDYMAYLYLCDDAAESNPYGSQPCQPAVDEVMGTCAADGVAQETSCRSAADCEDGSGVTWSCEGYVTPVDADTLPGTCTDPYGEQEEQSYVCNDEGSGYDDLSCACDTEIGRWITTYHREGRWVYDNSSMLPLLASGGSREFRYNTDGPYELDLQLRLSNQGKDAQPQELTYLFSGGTINSSYNASYEPITLEIPADATRVELATVISGHGSDSNNCAEFCDIAHHFTVNGDEANEIVRDFPEAATGDDCMLKVAEGTVPNQYGTWWYGRAGWCPGKEVPTVVHDITSQVTPGADNTFEYRALFGGAEYTGSATIRMRSWVVVSR